MTDTPYSDEQLDKIISDLSGESFDAAINNPDSYMAVLLESQAKAKQRLSRLLIEAKKEAYGLGLMTGGMPEAIGKPMAEDYLTELEQQRKELGDE